MANIYLRKYGVEATVNFELYELDGTDLVATAASASGDINLIRDEDAEEELDADAFVDEGIVYSLVVSATEMGAKRITIYIIDQSTPKIWLDKVLIIETYGNASAQHPFDLGTAATAMRGTDSAALASSWTAALATILANFSATRIGYLDELDFGLTEAIAALPTATEIQTEMEADGASLLDTIRDELANGTDGLSALLTAIQAISGDATAANQTKIIQLIAGKWEITGNQFIMYDSDGETALYTFDLTQDGVATEFNPDKRTPV